MVEIRFNGKFILPKYINPNTFIQVFNSFLQQQGVQISGQLRVNEFEDAEIIEEVCTNVEQTEAICPQKSVEDGQQ